MAESQFVYLADVAMKYGVDDVQISTRKKQFIDSLGKDDLAALGEAYREIERRGDVAALSSYVREARGKESRKLLLLLFLFSHLADRQIEPFASGTVFLIEEHETLDWGKLPSDLQYLADPAEKYGKYQFSDEMETFIETMTPEEKSELRDVDRRLESDREKARRFLDTFAMTKHNESARVYFLLRLIAEIHDRQGFE